MRGAYVATPLPTVELLLPYDWDPSWPYPGAHPPGYTTPKNPELVFYTPTPNEIFVDEETTIAVILRDITHELPMPIPEEGTSSIIWYAVLDEAVIWTSTSNWSAVSGYPGALKAFTPPLTDDDIGKTLTVYAESVVVYDRTSYPVSAEQDMEVKNPLSLSLICGPTTFSTSNPYYWPTRQKRVFFKLRIWNGAVCENWEQWQYDQHGFPYGAFYDEAHYVGIALPDTVTVTRVGWRYEVSISEIDPEKRYEFRIGAKVGKQPATLVGGFTAELLNKNLDVVDSLTDSGTGFLEEYAEEYYSVAGGIVTIEAGERELTLVDAWNSGSYPW